MSLPELGVLGKNTGGWHGTASSEQTFTGGKHFLEVQVEKTPDNTIMVGVHSADSHPTLYVGGDEGSYSLYCSNGCKYNKQQHMAYASICTVGDRLGCLLDLDNNSISFFKNDVPFGVAYTKVIIFIFILFRFVWC
jgi:hypothetical protein